MAQLDGTNWTPNQWYWFLLGRGDLFLYMSSWSSCTNLPLKSLPPASYGSGTLLELEADWKLHCCFTKVPRPFPAPDSRPISPRQTMMMTHSLDGNFSSDSHDAIIFVYGARGFRAVRFARGHATSRSKHLPDARARSRQQVGRRFVICRCSRFMINDLKERRTSRARAQSRSWGRIRTTVFTDENSF